MVRTVTVLHDKPWAKMDENKAIIACRALEASYLAALAPAQAVPGDMVLVPREPTAKWVHTLAEIRQGQSETPRCEPPTAYDRDVARRQIEMVLRAALAGQVSIPASGGDL